MRYLLAAIAALSFAAPVNAAVLATGTIGAGIRTSALASGAQPSETWRYRFSWTGVEDFSIEVRHGEEYLLSSAHRLSDGTVFVNRSIGLGENGRPYLIDGLSVTWESTTSPSYGETLFGVYPDVPEVCFNYPNIGLCGFRVRSAYDIIHLYNNSDNTGTWVLEGELVAVPEPSTWATMILGFAMIGVATRRRADQKSTAKTAC